MAKQPQLSTWAQEVNGRLMPCDIPHPTRIFGSTASARVVLAEENDGLNLIEIRLERGEEMREHQHEHAHILYVLGGSGVLKYDGTNHPVGPGSVYLIEANMLHGLVANTSMLIHSISSEFIAPDDSKRIQYND